MSALVSSTQYSKLIAMYHRVSTDWAFCGSTLLLHFNASTLCIATTIVASCQHSLESICMCTCNKECRYCMLQVVAAKQKGSASHAVTAANPGCTGPPCPPWSRYQEVRGDQAASLGHPAAGWLLLLSQFDHRLPELLCLLQCGPRGTRCHVF